MITVERVKVGYCISKRAHVKLKILAAKAGKTEQDYLNELILNVGKNQNKVVDSSK